MTVDEFKRDIESGKIVYCEDIYQTIEVLDLLDELGFALYETSADISRDIQQYIGEYCYSPGLDADGDIVCYYNYYVQNNLLDGNHSKVIIYDEILPLLKQRDLAIEDDFETAFQALCGMKR